MEQVLFGGHNTNLLDAAATEYNTLGGGSSWNADEKFRWQIISTDGVIKQLRVKLNDAPGAGKKYTFTLLLNGNPTPITFDIADAATTGSDMVNKVTVTGGDYVSIRCVPDSTPTARYATWTSVFEGDNPNESLILGGPSDQLHRTNIEYGQVMGAHSSLGGTENDKRQVVPTSGTIKNLYVKLDIDPGTPPDTYRFTVRLNGATVAQSLIAPVIANATTASDLVHNLAVVAGDYLTMMVEPVNTPGTWPYAAWGMTFVADIDGESIVIGGSYQGLDRWNTRYNKISSDEATGWGIPESNFYLLGQVCTLKKLRMLLTAPPGAGKHWDFNLRIAGAPSNVAVVIADAATTGNSGALEDDVALNEHVNLEADPDTVPDAADAYWGFVCYIAPSVSEDLPAGFTVRQGFADLAASFDGQVSLNLAAELIVSQVASQDLVGSFCVHLVRVAQDLAAWTEYDSGAFLTHDCNQVDWTDLTRAATDTALTKTNLLRGLGSRFFHQLHANLYDVVETPNGATERVCLWAGHIANVSHDFYGQNDNEIVALILHGTAVADEYVLELREKGGNSDFMAMTFPTLQSRYIVIYKDGAYMRATAYQSGYEGAIDDWCEITLSGDLDFDYVSIAMSYGQAGAESSSGYVDPIFGAFENLPAEFIVRHPGAADLGAGFEVRRSGSQELPSELIARQSGSQDLLVEFVVRRSGSQDLPGEFVIRRSASKELRAGFDQQTVLSLPAEFIARRDGGQDLAAGFNVNYWYHVSHLVITTGSITAGTVDDTRADDGNDLVLAETGLPADAFDYEFHWLNVPANQIFGIRLNGWYNGNPAHIIKLYEWNFTTPGWDAVTNAPNDIPSAVAEQDYVWMAGGPDYVSGGEYRLRILHTSPGNPVHVLNVDYLWLDISYAEFEDSPPAHFIARQPGSANLLGTFIVRHSGSQELGASFDGQVSLNLPAELSARRSTQQELAAEFTVNQSSKNLPAEFISRQPGSQVLLAVMNIVHFLDLGAKFEIRRSTSENLMGAMISRQADSQTLIAAFSVIPEASTDLLGGFISRKTIAPVEGVLIAYDPRPLFNIEIGVGTGFIGGIKEGSDTARKVAGEASMRVATRYEPKRNDYITFGWKYRYTQRFSERPGRNLSAGFYVRTSGNPGSSELAANFEVLGTNSRLLAGFTVNHFDFFGPWLVLTAGNPGNPEAVAYPHQENIFRYAGRWWIFYDEPDYDNRRAGPNYAYLKYISSTDGESWSGYQIAPLDGLPWQGALGSVSSPGSLEARMFSAWVHNGIVHIAVSPGDGFTGNDLFYKRGTMSGSGSISWDPRVTVVGIGATYHCKWPTICCDANGYPYITWYEQSQSGGQGALQYAYIIRSTTKDGTWTTDQNYGPIAGRYIGRLSTNTQIRYMAKPVPLPSGKIFAFFGGDAKQPPWYPGILYPSENEFLGRICGPNGMDATLHSKAIGSPWEIFYGGAAIADGNSVIAAVTCEDLTLRICKWNNPPWGDYVWSDSQIIQTGIPINTIPRFFKSPAGIVAPPEKLVVLWIDEASNEVRYKVSVDSGITWGPPGDTSYCVLKQYTGFGLGGTLQSSPTSAWGARTPTIHPWSVQYEFDTLEGGLGFTFVNLADDLMAGYIRRAKALGTI